MIRPVLMVEKTIHSKQWKKKIAKFQQETKKRNEIVFIGNSLTQDFDLSVFNNSAIKNRGISGDYTEGILLRLNEITEAQPEKIFLEIGINDILAPISTEKILKNYKKIIHQIKISSPSTQLYVQSILPTSFPNGFFVNNQQANQKIIETNKEIKRLCEKYSVTFVNLYDLFVENGKLNAHYTYDGIHLTKEGYRIWKEAIVEFVN